MTEGRQLADDGLLPLHPEIQGVPVRGEFIVLDGDFQRASYRTAAGHRVSGQAEVQQG